jgi:hypothetical protein
MRHRPSFADFVAIAIGPILIGLLVASLTFFLIDVFYQGAYNLRLKYIMAMFVMGAVGVGRISIEEGREYSYIYAVPLAIAAFVATLRFVEFPGLLERTSPILNIALIGIIWWCADRLVWDCTVIDEREKGSGEGLLQTVGLDGEPEDAATSESDDRPVDVSSPPAGVGLWRRFVEYRRRPHAPGVWVLYFSLAALPIFGVGQLFIQSDDLATRRSVFHLLVLYVAATLGLLLSTSFLGLRRNLRQRRLEMPPEMARAWLGFGATLIVAVMLFCTLLPRRNPEYSITQLSFLATSSDDLATSPWVFGNDGPEDPEQADRTVNRDGDQAEPAAGPGPPDENQPASGSESSQQSSSGQPQPGGSQQQGGEPASSDSDAQLSTPQQPSGDGRSASEADDSSGQPSGGQPDASQQPSGESAQNSGDRQGSAENNPSDGSRERAESGGRSEQEPDGGDSELARESSQQERTPDDTPAESQNEQESSAKQSSQSRASDQQPSQQPQQSSADESPSEEDRSGNNENQQQERSGASRSNSGPRQSPSRAPRFSPSRAISSMVTGIGSLIKIVYWLVIGLLVIFFLVRYWRQVMRAIREFVAAVKQWWQRLIGRSPTVGDQAIAEDTVQRPPSPRFAEFVDPFSSGMADKYSTDALIKYSFEAFEAWGREHGVSRDPDQTAHEFARAVSRRSSPLSKHAFRIADLYSWSAFAHDSVPRTSIEYLRTFWQQLRKA